jgi:site-specific DNA-adenine methylase
MEILDDLKIKKKTYSNLIGRLGNKELDLKYFINFLPKDIKTICEPFGGSFAVSRKIYYEDKYKKKINDLDPLLFYIYKNPKEYAQLINNVMSNFDKCKKKEDLLIFLDKYECDDKLKKSYLQQFLIRGSLHKKKKISNYDDNIKMMEKIEFTNKDYMTIINENSTNKDCFLFLDPPYLFSDNSGYFTQQNEKDMTNIIVDLQKIIFDKKIKAKVMLIINKLSILEHIFKGYIVGEYTKQYSMSKKIMKHLIICNYKI